MQNNRDAKVAECCSKKSAPQSSDYEISRLILNKLKISKTNLAKCFFAKCHVQINFLSNITKLTGESKTNFKFNLKVNNSPFISEQKTKIKISKLAFK